MVELNEARLEQVSGGQGDVALGVASGGWHPVGACSDGGCGMSIVRIRNADLTYRWRDEGWVVYLGNPVEGLILGGPYSSYDIAWQEMHRNWITE